MTSPYKNILLAIPMSLITLSCGESGSGRQSMKKNSALNTSDIFQPADTADTYFDPLLFGSKFRIMHESYGCFHHYSRYIDVEENKGSYSVILKDGFSANAYPPVRLDSDFAAALRDFNIFHTRLSDLKSKQKPKEGMSIGTINRLTINGGIKNTLIFCDSAFELSGFNNLINRINLMITEKNGS